MDLDSVRGLKAELAGSGTFASPAPRALVALNLMDNLERRTQALAQTDPLPRTVALGVARRTKNDYRLAIRIQRRSLERSPQIEAIRRKAKNEVDIRYIGHVTKLATLTARTRQRPLRIGLSIGHYKVTAGTLGAFVTLRVDGQVRILSNNHVLANENRARVGDAIVQPGIYDGGKRPKDVVGTLAEFVRLSKTRLNNVDCALAAVRGSVKYAPALLRGHGTLKGVATTPVDIGDRLEKLGRTTGHTRGRITAFELDNVIVGYDMGNLRFDDQIEVEGVGIGPFCQGGDSGSLVYNTGDHLAVGLLFAGGDTGGRNGAGLTYVNPIARVLRRLRVDLLL